MTVPYNVPLALSLIAVGFSLARLADETEDREQKRILALVAQFCLSIAANLLSSLLASSPSPTTWPPSSTFIV